MFDFSGGGNCPLAPPPDAHAYMVVVDYYSRWIEILHLSNMTTAAGIATLKYIFARCGIPTELVSDNAPQLSSSEFLIYLLHMIKWN